MADAEEKSKAEKLAAAKKRVEALKKQKQKKAGPKKEEKAESPKVEETPEPAAEVPEPIPEEVKEEVKEPETQPADEDTPLVSAVPHGRQPSISIQSKQRSASFRAGTGGPLSPSGYGFSPDGETAPDIHRKQALRIDELEKENKRLAKEASEGERRWKKAEEELEVMREAEDELAPKARDESASPGTSGEVEKLRTEIAALQRQNSQLQAQSSRTPRHGSSPSISAGMPAEYEAALASKSSTIESMEIEISTLRARLDQIAAGSSEKEQVTALEEKLNRSEKSAAIAQRELGDLKKNLDRTTEKAVKEGSERISAETKLRTLEREAEEARSQNEELQKKVEALEKKVATLATLHKEHDARFQTQKRDKEKAEKEASELRARLVGIESENTRLQDERTKARNHQGADDEGVDELENEERQRLEKKVRDLEGEVHELRRGVWRERRQEMQGGPDDGPVSPSKFTDIDLGGMSPNRRRSIAQGKGGFQDFISSGINAITGANAFPSSAADDGLLEDDEDMDFDEEAFRLAQEEEAKKRIERVKDVKRALKNWEGYRLDLVENRKGGGEGVGEIFEV